MCQPVPCRTCGKTTWAGCGEHVDDVKAAVPAEHWCPGHEQPDGTPWLRRVLGHRNSDA